ncbi:Protein GVQW3 [Anthophora quadrimaculata]
MKTIKKKKLQLTNGENEWFMLVFFNRRITLWVYALFTLQRCNVKFCVKLGKTFTETFALLKQAYGGDTFSRTQYYEWFVRFKTGRQSIEDDPRPGRPLTATDNTCIEKISDLVRANCRLTVRELSEKVGISIGSCHEILKKFAKPLLIRQFCAKNHMTVLLQPPYSPDFAPYDFFLFSKLKSVLKGRRFNSVEDIKHNSSLALKDIPKEAYQDCMVKWKHRWNKCVDRGGEYFEGDKDQ